MIFAGLDSNSIITIVLSGFGISGIVGAAVAIYKVRPDVDSSVVVQAKGTVEMMHLLLDEQRIELIRKEEECGRLRKMVADQANVVAEQAATILHLRSILREQDA